MIPIVLDRASAAPLAAQLAASVRRFVTTGGIAAGQAMPSTRALATQLGVSRGTVVAAYDQLTSEGYLVSTPGGKTRIHPDARSSGKESVQPSATRQAARTAEPRIRQTATGQTTAGKTTAQLIDLTPHRRPSAAIDDPAWREAWRRAAAEPTPRGEIQGLADLRAAIAEHLQLLRAMRVDPDDIIVTSGARDGLSLVLAALGESAMPVAVEAPGYPGLRRVLHRRGVELRDAPVDADGIIADRIPADARAVLVTPNHLFPAGTHMPAARRIELLRHAGEHGQIVIEDDFDSDYRHIGAPMPTLRDLDAEAVLHLGTFSQVLTASAGIGYIITPQRHRSLLADARADLGAGPPLVAQRAVATFLDSGGLRRHITRRRRELLRRRRTVLEALADWPVEMVSGAHALVELSSAAEAERAERGCAARGVEVGRLNQYWAGSLADATGSAHGIVLNCADVDPPTLERAVAAVDAALREA